jgi:hypothetical protein
MFLIAKWWGFFWGRESNIEKFKYLNSINVLLIVMAGSRQLNTERGRTFLAEPLNKLIFGKKRFRIAV